MDKVSDMRGIRPIDVDTDSSFEGTGARTDISLMDEDDQVNISIEYQRRAYAEGSMRKFMVIYVKQFRKLVRK